MSRVHDKARDANGGHASAREPCLSDRYAQALRSSLRNMSADARAIAEPSTTQQHLTPHLTPNDCADQVLKAIRASAKQNLLEGIAGHALLWERAQLMQLDMPANQRSANGHCHLLRTRTGWFAVNLARREDIELLPAWLETAAVCRTPQVIDWQVLEASIGAADTQRLSARANVMGLPFAAASSHRPKNWFDWQPRTNRLRRTAAPLIIDLSALWAGPLCAHLLGLMGGWVIKVESSRRPDASREGAPALFARLNQGKRSVLLDFRTPRGVKALSGLLRRADIVITGSRPRALQQLGIDADSIINNEKGDGALWVAITGYGVNGDNARRVAFGDDAAIAGGLFYQPRGHLGPNACPPEFYGDAIADPLTGLHATLAATHFWRAGQSGLLGVALADVAHQCASWCDQQIRLPRAHLPVRDQQQPLAELGAHTAQLC